MFAQTLKRQLWLGFGTSNHSEDVTGWTDGWNHRWRRKNWDWSLFFFGTFCCFWESKEQQCRSGLTTWRCPTWRAGLRRSRAPSSSFVFCFFLRLVSRFPPPLLLQSSAKIFLTPFPVFWDSCAILLRFYGFVWGYWATCPRTTSS